MSHLVDTSYPKGNQPSETTHIIETAPKLGISRQPHAPIVIVTVELTQVGNFHKASYQVAFRAISVARVRNNGKAPKHQAITSVEAKAAVGAALRKMNEWRR